MQTSEDRPDLQYRPFGDWDIDLPQITTVTPGNDSNPIGWLVNSTNRKAICTSFREPPSVPGPAGDSSRADWEPASWWQGYQMHIPGQGTQELLLRTAGNTATPGVGGLSYPIVTKQNWSLGCLAQASNDATRQGFMAVSPDGTKYFLDHLTYRYMPTMTRPVGSSPVSLSAMSTDAVMTPMAALDDILPRREGRMLVTRVEDRFGNYLLYSYRGDTDQVSDIVASDGRHVTFVYEANSPRISSVTAVTNVFNRFPAASRGERVIGRATEDGRVGYRIEYDKRGAHFNTFSGKEKEHFYFEGTQKTVDSITDGLNR